MPMTQTHAIRDAASVSPNRWLAMFCALAALWLGSLAVVQAQAAPAPSPTPSSAAPPTGSGDTQNAPVPKPLTAAARAPIFYPIIDIVPIATFQGIGGFVPGVGGGSNGIKQNLDIGGTFKIPLGNVFSVSFDRSVGGTLDTGAERVTDAKGKYVYPAYSQDITLVYRGDAQLRQFLIEGGMVFRHRVCCPGSGDPHNPSSTEAHYGYLGLTYATPALKFLNGANFVFNGTGQLANHRKSALAKPSPLDIGDTLEHTTSQSVTINYPFDRKKTFTASVKDTWGALNWYENAPFPYQWAGQTTYLATKKFNSLFSLALRYVDQHQRKQGAPYVFPNAQHQEAWSVLADFHIDTSPGKR